MNLKHRFVFVSKDENFCFDRDASDAFSAKYPTIRFDYIQNNSQALPDVYNLILNECDTKEYDFTYFIHADVSLNFEKLIEHVESVNGKYDVIGLCGCSNFNVSQSPLNWFCGSRPVPNGRWGCVTHGELGNQKSFFSRHSPDVTDHEVACIDGLCIIFSKKAVNSGMRFDPSLGAFDFYDTDISMQTVLKYGMKLGVIVRDDLIHSSVGKSILTEDFLKNELKFRNKWNLPIPPESAVARIASHMNSPTTV